MNFIAIKMLLGDRAKYIGIVIGLTFASLLITQQSAIFIGIMTRTFSFLTDVGQPDVWVVDPQAQYIEDIKPLQDTQVLRVRAEQKAWNGPSDFTKARSARAWMMAHFKRASSSAWTMRR